MKFIKGVTFAPFVPSGCLGTEEAKESLVKMKERTGADFVILAPGAVQETPISEEIDFRSERTMTDAELIDTIRQVKSLGLRVALKPTVNCADGTWRGHIHFFDVDVPCEPKWGNWFASYTAFQLHYAKIAEEEGCELFIAGCEMVMTEIREKEWRKLIADIREVFHGPVSYNTDKYQEGHVNWWDAVDVISSSGYYPADNWENQLDRIEAVVKKFDRRSSSRRLAACQRRVPLRFRTTGRCVAVWHSRSRRTFTAPCSRHAKRETGCPGSGSGRGTGACRSAPGHSRKKDMNSMKNRQKKWYGIFMRRENNIDSSFCGRNENRQVL